MLVHVLDHCLVLITAAGNEGIFASFPISHPLAVIVNVVRDGLVEDTLMRVAHPILKRTEDDEVHFALGDEELLVVHELQAVIAVVPLMVHGDRNVHGLMQQRFEETSSGGRVAISRVDVYVVRTEIFQRVVLLTLKNDTFKNSRWTHC